MAPKIGEVTARALSTLLAVVVLLTPTAVSGDAVAGVYTVHSCRAPDGAPASTDGWSWSATEPALTGYAAACPNGGISLKLLPGKVHDTDANAYMRFSAPSATEVVRYRIWRSARLTAAERYFYSPTETLPGGREEWALTRCGGKSNSCTAVGNAATPLAAANYTDRTPPNPLAQYGVYISCGLTTAEEGDCKATSPVSADATIWRAETDLLDDDWPAFPAAPTGSLLEGGTLSGVKRVSTVASDRGGGLASTAVEVDGTVLARETFSDAKGTCRQPYTVRVPCPGTSSGTFSLDTADLADGVHRVRVLATDAAGNTAAWGPVEVSTDNSAAACTPAPAPAGAGVKLETWIAAAKAARRRRGDRGRGRTAAAAPNRVTVPIGTATIVSGRLTDAAGAPAAGAPICVSTRVGDDGALTRLARLTTDGYGRYSVRVPAGSSRQVWAVHRVAGGAVAAKATVHVRAAVTLKPARTRLRAGQVLSMRGALAGRPIPRGGVLVNVQARRGRTWQTFRQVRVGASGRYRVRYRFVGGRGVRRYALRAAVPQQSAYPYAAATSRPFHVRVQG